MHDPQIAIACAAEHGVAATTGSANDCMLDVERKQLRGRDTEQVAMSPSRVTIMPRLSSRTAAQSESQHRPHCRTGFSILCLSEVANESAKKLSPESRDRR